MSYGLQVFGENGEVVFDSNKITTTFLGTYITRTLTGSFTPTTGIQVKQLWAALPNLSKGHRTSTMSVWVKGRTIYWESQRIISVPIIYGGYS